MAAVGTELEVNLTFGDSVMTWLHSALIWIEFLNEVLGREQVEKSEKTLATDNFQPETGPTSPLDDVQPHETCLKWRIEQVVSDAGSVDVAAINTSISIAIDDVAPLESVNAIGDAVGANPFIRFLSSLRHQSRDLPLKFVFPFISRHSDANLILISLIDLSNGNNKEIGA